MKRSLRTGLGFGITSGIITTIGLMVGLYSGTQSQLAVIGGVLTIAIADSFSDALGIHVSKEFENISTTRCIWEATITTLLSKFILATMFIIPLMTLELKTAINLSIVLGVIIMAAFSAFIAKDQKVPMMPVIAEHLAIMIFVLFATHYAGIIIRSYFF